MCCSNSHDRTSLGFGEGGGKIQILLEFRLKRATIVTIEVKSQNKVSKPALSNFKRKGQRELKGDRYKNIPNSLSAEICLEKFVKTPLLS